MNREELLESLRESLLLQVARLHIEQLNQLPIILKGIDYLEDKAEIISEITRCELIKSDQFKIRRTDIEGSKILVDYEIPSIALTAWSDKTQILRVVLTMKGLFAVPDIDQYDWHANDFSEMSKEEILEKKSLVYILETFYENIECDDVRLMG